VIDPDYMYDLDNLHELPIPREKSGCDDKGRRWRHVEAGLLEMSSTAF
jgi:hypothetical protein